MFQNQIKLIVRNLLKQRGFSFINIVGLAIGMSACLIIVQYVQFELSYDSFHLNKDQVFRTVTSSYANGEFRGDYPLSGYAQGPSLNQDYPEVDSYCRIHPQYGGAVVSANNAGQEVLFHEENMYFVDSSFFNHFTFTLELGDGQTALSKPMSLVLTREMADKYFGEGSDPIGEVLQLSGGWTEGLYAVTGILDPLPQNSHLEFDFLLSMHDLLENGQYQDDDGWGWSNFATYVKLVEGANAAELEGKLPEFVTKYEGEGLAETNSENIIKLQPVTEIHLTADLEEEVASTGSSSTVYSFAIIALFILLIAWVNYINLSTARAPERAREVGIKKVVGAAKNHLMRQFMLESLLINSISAVIALAVAWVCLPLLGAVIGKTLALDLLANIEFWGAFIGVLILGSLLSGLYPAFVLSAYKPASILKSSQTGGGSSLLRKALVIFQFGASLILIAGTMTVYKQISFMHNQQMSLSLDQVLVVKGPRVVEEGVSGLDIFNRFKNDLLQLPAVKSVASSSTVPGGGFNWGSSFRKVGDDPELEKPGNVTWVDTAFIATYQLELISGHNWNQESQSDMESVIVNETALATFGLGDAEEALEQAFAIGDDTVEIIGVLSDFHWSSPKSAREAILFAPTPGSSGNFSIRLETDDLQASVTNIKELYAKHSPGNPFDYFFMDEFFNRQYQADIQFGKLFAIFSMLAVFVGCLGLFGLVSYTVVQKTREIGIRKVLGANVSGIVMMLSKQFVLLVLIASGIVLPVAYWVLSEWLAGYAFPITMDWDLLVLPVLTLVVIALFTVSLQTVKAARANPVESIRAE